MLALDEEAAARGEALALVAALGGQHPPGRRLEEAVPAGDRGVALEPTFAQRRLEYARGAVRRGPHLLHQARRDFHRRQARGQAAAQVGLQVIAEVGETAVPANRARVPLAALEGARVVERAHLEQRP